MFGIIILLFVFLIIFIEAVGYALNDLELKENNDK
jgi:hypothetical protein